MRIGSVVFPSSPRCPLEACPTIGVKAWSTRPGGVARVVPRRRARVGPYPRRSPGSARFAERLLVHLSPRLRTSLAVSAFSLISMHTVSVASIELLKGLRFWRDLAIIY